MDAGPIRSRSALIEIYTSASGFTLTRPRQPCAGPGPGAGRRVGVAPAHPRRRPTAAWCRGAGPHLRPPNAALAPGLQRRGWTRR